MARTPLVLALLLALGAASAAPVVGKPKARMFPRPPLPRVYHAISEFGPRQGRVHPGIDLKIPRGTPVYAVEAGRVARSGWLGDYGWVVELRHRDGWVTRYGHLLARPKVKEGQQLADGAVLGAVGASGNATTPHLHFETRDPKAGPVNPRGHVRF